MRNSVSAPHYFPSYIWLCSTAILTCSWLPCGCGVCVGIAHPGCERYVKYFAAKYSDAGSERAAQCQHVQLMYSNTGCTSSR
jgi:hypothetical protein